MSVRVVTPPPAAQMPDDWEWEPNRIYSAGSFAKWRGIGLLCVKSHTSRAKLDTSKFLLNVNDWKLSTLVVPLEWNWR